MFLFNETILSYFELFASCYEPHSFSYTYTTYMLDPFYLNFSFYFPLPCHQYLLLICRPPLILLYPPMLNIFPWSQIPINPHLCPIILHLHPSYPIIKSSRIVDSTSVAPTVIIIHLKNSHSMKTRAKNGIFKPRLHPILYLTLGT